MPNKQYEKGRRKEYKISNELKEMGYDIVQRTAGSHSAIDIIAIHKDTRTIEFIQAKPDNLSKNKKEAIESDLSFLNGSFFCKFKVV